MKNPRSASITKKKARNLSNTVIPVPFSSDAGTPSGTIIARAVFDFEGDDYDQLSFQVGDLITIIEQNPSGWWTGELKGRVGIFPYNYIELDLPENDVPNLSSTKNYRQFENVDHDAQEMKIPHHESSQKISSPSANNVLAKALSLPAKPVYGKTRIGPWGSNMGKSGGFMCILFGIAAIVWATAETDQVIQKFNGIGIYSILLGFGIRYYEQKWGRKPSTGKRAATYIVLSIPLLFTWTTSMAAAILWISAFVHIFAACTKESYEIPRNVLFKWKSLVYGRGDDAEKSLGIVGNTKRWIKRKHEQNQMGYCLVAFAYLSICTIIVFTRYRTTSSYFREQGDSVKTWGSIARGTARLLGLNSCFLLFPVSQSFIRGLFNKAFEGNQSSSRYLRVVNLIFPFPTALELHILMARVNVVVAIAHTFIHFINYATTPDGVFDSYPFLTGSLIFLTMLFIYSASDPFVRRGHLRLFWNCHYLFPVFYIFLMIHTKLSAEFAVFFFVPGLTYLFERFYRWYSKIKSVNLCTSYNMRNSVMIIEISKADAFGNQHVTLKPGQYFLVNCPVIDRDQWVPMTPTSSPEEETLTFHVRIQGEDSWTAQLQKYMATFNSQPEVDHHTYGAFFTIQGSHGHTILKLDGPQTAPTQHLSNFSKVLLIGTGIGVTPLVSALNSIVHYLWRSEEPGKFPQHAYFCAVMKHKDIKSFRYLINQLKEACDGIADLRERFPEQMADRVFEFHIYITSIPESFEEAYLPAIGDWSFWGRSINDRLGSSFPHFLKVAPFSPYELYKATEKPDVTPKTLGEVRIHRGRPEWSEIFDILRTRYPRNEEIGVSFCGNPELLEEIGHCTTIYSSPADGRVFTLHAEKFD